MDSWLPIFLQRAVIHYFHSLFFCSYRPSLGSWEPRPGLLGPPTARPLSLSTSSRRARLALSSAAGLQVGLPSLGSQMLTTHQGPGGLRVGPSQAEVTPPQWSTCAERPRVGSCFRRPKRLLFPGRERDSVQPLCEDAGRMGGSCRPARDTRTPAGVVLPGWEAEAEASSGLGERGPHMFPARRAPNAASFPAAHTHTGVQRHVHMCMLVHVCLGACLCDGGMCMRVHVYAWACSSRVPACGCVFTRASGWEAAA